MEMAKKQRQEKNPSRKPRGTLDGVQPVVIQASNAPPKPLDLRGIADYLGVHTNTVLRAARRGLPHFRIGNRLRFDPSQVIVYLQERNKSKAS